MKTNITFAEQDTTKKHDYGALISFFELLANWHQEDMQKTVKTGLNNSENGVALDKKIYDDIKKK